MKKIYGFLLFAVFIFLLPIEQVNSQDTIREKIDSIAASYLSQPNTVGLMVGFFRQRSNPNIPPVPEFYGYGHIRNDTTFPAPDSLTVFKLGSVGKTFTATLLAYLMQFHPSPVRLLDRIAKYLPDTLNVPVWVNGSDTTFITIGELAMHFSSFPDQPTNYVTPPHYTVQKLLEFVDTYVLPHRPGTVWTYSNTGFGLLGVITGRISGETYEELSDRLISDSLNMPDTRVTPTPSMWSRVALGYNHTNGNLDTAAISPGFYGAGGHYSTMKDLMHYLRWNLGFVDNSMKVLLDTLHKQRRHAFNDTVSGQGLAWQMNYLYHLQSQERFIWKDGGTSGYSTYICWLPKTRTGVVVLSNSTLAVDAYAVSMLKAINPLNTLGGVGINQISTNIPQKFILHQNYPNPFNPVTKIKFDLPKSNGYVSLKVYNVLGQVVSELINQSMQAGTYEYEFDASGISSGMYYYSLQVDGETVGTRKMVIIK